MNVFLNYIKKCTLFPAFFYPRLIVLIAKILYKMTPKDIIIGAFQLVDRIKIRL